MDSTIVQWSAGGIFVLMLFNTLVNVMKKRNGNDGLVKDRDFCRHEKEMKQFIGAVTNNIAANTQVLTELSLKTDTIYKKLV